MDLNFSKEDLAFRDEVKEFLDKISQAYQAKDGKRR